MPRCHAIQTRNAKINAKMFLIYIYMYTHVRAHRSWASSPQLNWFGMCVCVLKLMLDVESRINFHALCSVCISADEQEKNQTNRIKLFTQFTHSCDVLKSSFFAWYSNGNAV